MTLKFQLYGGSQRHITCGSEVSVVTEAQVALAVHFACPETPPLPFWEQNLAPLPRNNLEFLVDLVKLLIRGPPSLAKEWKCN